MNFRQRVKAVNKTKIYEMKINPIELKAQYNPERFHLWRSLHTGPKKEVLNMMYSPHYKFLCDRTDDTYRRLQRLYGRKNKWINAKIKKFLTTYESIKENGFIEKVEILETPIVENPFNSSYEIFEGHHRVSCALFLEFRKIPCIVIRKE